MRLDISRRWYTCCIELSNKMWIYHVFWDRIYSADNTHAQYSSQKNITVNFGHSQFSLIQDFVLGYMLQMSLTHTEMNWAFYMCIYCRYVLILFYIRAKRGIIHDICSIFRLICTCHTHTPYTPSRKMWIYVVIVKRATFSGRYTLSIHVFKQKSHMESEKDCKHLHHRAGASPVKWVPTWAERKIFGLKVIDRSFSISFSASFSSWRSSVIYLRMFLTLWRSSFVFIKNKKWKFRLTCFTFRLEWYTRSKK